MLKQTLNKGISTPIAIGIILVLVILVGVFTWWQYSEVWKEGAKLSEIKKSEIAQEYTCNSNQDCAKKTGQCELECLHKDQESEIDPEIECEWLPWYSRERCECINNRCVKVTCEDLGLDYITCDAETEKDECYLDSDCNNNYWCWKGVCSPPIPGETNNCEKNICIRTCNTNKDCEEGKSWCKFINLFEGGDVSVGLRKGCVGPDFYYAAD